MTGVSPPASSTPPRTSPQHNTLRKRPFLAWLYAPTPEAFLFSFRTSIAACLALGIAFWLELDSPAWAAMTVWSVAQFNRGEALSKARWRMVGTVIGAVASVMLFSLAPQAPWLFFPIIATWIGFCCGLATFVSNFRSYALVLAGYTCSIICTDAAPNGGHIFFYAVARSSYIILGVLCEGLLATIFSYNQEYHARLTMRKKLKTALDSVSVTLANILEKTPGALSTARQQFEMLIKANNEIEFSEIEMGARDHAGDHARATLAAVSILLSRGVGMATRLQLLTNDHQDLNTITNEVLTFLDSFSGRVSQEHEIPDLLADLQHLRDICRQYAAPHRLATETATPSLSALNSAEVKRMQAEGLVKMTTSDLDERVLFISLGELLGDLELAITQYYASFHTVRSDHFQFRRSEHRDVKLAVDNGLRSGLAIIITALIYEITAWPQGLQFIGLTSLICGLYATRDNPVLATTSFLKGILASLCIAWVLVMFLIPATHSYEALFIVLGSAMMIGGLAKANPGTAGGAASYGLLMPAMLGLQNHHIMNEVAFYNNNLAILMGGIVSVVVFRSILPFNNRDERFRLRKLMLKELRNQADPEHTASVKVWVGHNTDRFARLLRHAGKEGGLLVEQYIRGTLATLTLGLNVIRLRTLMDREYLPESARRPIALVLHHIATARTEHDQIALTATAAIRRLRKIDATEQDTVTRLELTRAITYLVVIAYTLYTNVNFLDSTRLFSEEKHLPLPPQYQDIEL